MLRLSIYIKGVERVCYSESNIEGTFEAKCPESMKLDRNQNCLPCDEACISNTSDETNYQ
jgi:hypothetical protein